jgi:hypothetical protein
MWHEGGSGTKAVRAAVGSVSTPLRQDIINNTINNIINESLGKAG